MRLPFVDNLRSTLVLWVVAFHTAIAYSHVGQWYWQDPAPVGETATLAFLWFETHSQAFFMGILFLVSGYFVPAAYDRKGAWRFLRYRFMRLGIPSLLYIFAVQPLMLHFLLGAGRNGFAGYYAGFMRSGDWTSGSGPMWFALALLIFCAAYVLWRRAVPATGSKPAAPHLKHILLFGLGIAGAAFLIRIFLPIGTSFLYFQPAFFAQYVVLFVVGIAAYRGEWFVRLPTGFGYFCLASAGLFTMIVWPALMISGGGLEAGFAAFVGGWNWQNAGYAFWESIFCVLASAGLLTLFRERFNTAGRLSRLLSDNAFAIYFLHPPVVVAITMAFAPLALPPLVKWAVVAPCAMLAALLAAVAVRQVPVLRKVL